MIRRWWWGLVAVVVFPCLAQAATVTPPRAGQVGLAVQGQYGTMLNGGSFGESFSTGGGLAVRVRYRMRYERGLGLSFESQSFDARTSAPEDTAIRKITMITTGVEVYQMFGTRTRTTRMLSVGAGIVQPSVKLNSGDVTYPDDGVYVSAGAGIEHFVWRTWGLDVSTRYLAVFHERTTNHDFQASAGIVFYASY